MSSYVAVDSRHLELAAHPALLGSTAPHNCTPALAVHPCVLADAVPQQQLNLEDLRLKYRPDTFRSFSNEAAF
jgi:hypothetical protein